MRKINSLLWLVLFLSSAVVYPSGIISKRIDTSGSNLAATFPSLAQFGVAPNGFSEVDINNGTGTDIEVNCVSSTQPSSNSVTSFYVPAGIPYNSSTTPGLQDYMGKLCWLRSVSGTISTGVITIIGYSY